MDLARCVRAAKYCQSVPAPAPQKTIAPKKQIISVTITNGSHAEVKVFGERRDAQEVDAKNEGMTFNPPDVTMLDVQRAVCAYFKTTLIDLKSTRRQAEPVFYRHVAMYLCKILTPQSLPAIGRAFGGRDHTTIRHAMMRIERLREQDAVVNEMVRTIIANLAEAATR
jgi:hypothetical protein